MKLVTYIPEEMAKSLREAAINIHNCSHTITAEQLRKGVEKVDIYKWEILKNGEYRTAAVFQSIPVFITIFPNILIPFANKNLLCEINMYATTQTTMPEYLAQYLLQIYPQEEKWKDELIDIYPLGTKNSLINVSIHAPFLLNQLSLCLLTGEA